MAEPVTITETLRDAWQGLPRAPTTEQKHAFARRLVAAGFPSLDVGSFVSPRRVPAMADTAELLKRLAADGAAEPAGAGAAGGAARTAGRTGGGAARRPRLTALVASASGLERLLAAPGVDEVLYPFSLSERFQLRNTERGREQAFVELRGLTERAHAAGRAMYATISMAFGNNEGEAFDPAELREWVARLHGETGVDRVGLADTTAQATPRVIAEVYAAVLRGAAWPAPAAHLHVTPENQAPLVDAALDAGCRAFDSALGALGGCQFAKGAVSNVSTRPLVGQLLARGFACELAGAPLAELEAAARELAEACREPSTT